MPATQVLEDGIVTLTPPASMRSAAKHRVLERRSAAVHARGARLGLEPFRVALDRDVLVHSDLLAGQRHDFARHELVASRAHGVHRQRRRADPDPARRACRHALRHSVSGVRAAVVRHARRALAGARARGDRGRLVRHQLVVRRSGARCDRRPLGAGVARRSALICGSRSACSGCSTSASRCADRRRSDGLPRWPRRRWRWRRSRSSCGAQTPCTASATCSRRPGTLHGGAFWAAFFPSVIGVVSFWATLALNIPDYSRYAQIAERAVARTARDADRDGAVRVHRHRGHVGDGGVDGKALWNPVDLLLTFPTAVVLIGGIIVILSSITINVGANVMAPARAFENLWPRVITFGIGAILTGLLSLVMQPWYVLAAFSNVHLHVARLVRHAARAVRRHRDRRLLARARAASRPRRTLSRTAAGTRIPAAPI